MKKIMLVFALIFSLTAAKAQQNLTIVISDKVEAGYFKQESFKWNVQGITSIAEAKTFVTNLKKDTNIKSASIAASTTAGEYTLIFAVNKIYDKKYFQKAFYAVGVRQAIVNGKTEILPIPSAVGH